MADGQLEKNYEPLLVARSTAEKHWGLLQSALQGVLPDAGGGYLVEPLGVGGASATLTCVNFRSETADRVRGGSVSVVPLIHNDPLQLRFWLNLNQEWREASRNKLSYHTTGLTVFLGEAGKRDKLQLFRAEWAGVRTQSSGIFAFEAPGAGHPHWQFDVYESRAVEVEDERRRVEELARALEDIAQVADFSNTVVAELSPENIVDRNLYMRRLSRTHFASCANWSKFPWNGDEFQTKAHAQGPADVSEIQNWIISTVVYLGRELVR
jgi:hypothetical protein